MTIEDEVDRLIDERPGKELLIPCYDDPAHRVTEILYRSGGTTAAYCLLTDRSRIIVNTGMGYEAPHHKRVFDAVRPGPTPYVMSTQAHVDHVGGVELFREPGTVYVAQENNLACQRDDARIRPLRFRTAGIWFDMTGRDAVRIAKENPGVSMGQDEPTPDLTFDERLDLEVDGLHLQLIAAVGETIDGMIVWLPEHKVALISNLLGPLFPHFPNLNTLRGDRYRFVEPYLHSVRLLRELQPEMLVTGRHEPIVGGELIDASLARLHNAVEWVHRETVDGMNTGVDLWHLMREIRLPSHLRVGQGYGKVPWAVRTIWETYVGWFKLTSTTELYPDQQLDARTVLTAALGVAGTLDLARQALGRGDAALAVLLAEGALAVDPDHQGAGLVMADAHQALLDAGGDVNFWESGWLEWERRRWAAGAEPPPR
ncbi:MAG TPA: alkyl sulfatase dimerization domain-containing protein [Acidimicrobiales bacterium]|nr:alkyl sulfatase dimerization domain-containing protein [Acidimicrobiales bacterium]